MIGITHQLQLSDVVTTLRVTSSRSLKRRNAKTYSGGGGGVAQVFFVGEAFPLTLVRPRVPLRKIAIVLCLRKHKIRSELMHTME